jgi:hypothetical protein
MGFLHVQLILSPGTFDVYGHSVGVRIPWTVDRARRSPERISIHCEGPDWSGGPARCRATCFDQREIGRRRERVDGGNPAVDSTDTGCDTDGSTSTQGWIPAGDRARADVVSGRSNRRTPPSVRGNRSTKPVARTRSSGRGLGPMVLYDVAAERGVAREATAVSLGGPARPGSGGRAALPDAGGTGRRRHRARRRAGHTPARDLVRSAAGSQGVPPRPCRLGRRRYG